MQPVINAAPGDVGFVFSPTILGILIRKFTRSKGEPPTKTNHTIMFTEHGKVGDVPVLDQASAIEAVWHVEEGPWVERHKKDFGARLYVYGPTFLSPVEAQRIVQNARSHLGAKYGWWKLVTFAFERWTKIPITRLHFLTGRPICSFLISMAYKEVGFPSAFGVNVPSQAQSPDDQLDFVESHPQLWVLKGVYNVA